MSKYVCISGYYGFDNFGDEMILKVLVENLKNFDCDINITVFSSNPIKTSKAFKVNSVNSFNITDVIKEILRCNCLVSGGGSLLQDVTSSKSLIYYLGIIFLAELFQKKIIIFAQGIGPVKNKLLACLTAFILKNAKFITVRDEESIKLLNSWNINAVKCNDPVWNLTNINSEKKDKVGIQLRGWKNLTDDMLFGLANAVNKCFADKEISIYSLQNSLDFEVCSKFHKFLLKINADIRANVIENTSNEKITEEISSLKFLIAMRYHACLIGIKSGTAVLPVSYDIKVTELAKQFNLDYIDINKFEEAGKKLEIFKNKNIKYDTEKINNLKYNFKDLEKIL